MIGYIYTREIDGKMYVGSTINIEMRSISHKAILKVIEEVSVENRRHLIRIENYWIEQFRQWGFPMQNKIANLSYVKIKVDRVKKEKITYTNIKEGSLKKRFSLILGCLTSGDKFAAESLYCRPTIDKYLSGRIIKESIGEMLFNFFYERIQARAMKMATV